ncbi:hypothetical protein D3C79_650890 [compost metagenome]
MNDLQCGLPGEFAAEVVQVHAGDTQAMREQLDRQVFAVVLFDQLDKARKQLLVTLVTVARQGVLLAAAADPDHQ